MQLDAGSTSTNKIRLPEACEWGGTHIEDMDAISLDGYRDERIRVAAGWERDIERSCLAFLVCRRLGIGREQERL